MTESARGTGRNIAGAEYVSALSTRPSDLRARDAFRARALELVPAGGLIYDFGAGPGLDARYYAEHERRVAAYDIDPEMCRYFADYCGELIRAGRISLDQGSYAQFLASARTRGNVDLVTANFAPLNLVSDLPGLFAALAGLTRPDGCVLASVLSPYYVGDLTYRWWWRNLPLLLRRGEFAVPGAQALIWRRRLPAYAAASAPWFTLESAYPGTTHSLGRVSVRGVAAGAPGAWLSLTRSRYMFLLFRKPVR
ncbi:MAG: class I SAM-dependent methyltransferase [Proteobacteria bacterium]|nr:class I SAM-dependent methyltransferase [Pseudomonadota bacterium]